MTRTKLGIAVVLLLPMAAATPAMAHPGTRGEVLHLRVVPSSDIDLGTGYVAADEDYDQSGAHVGSDVTTCRAANAASTQARCDVGLALAGGLLLITFTENEGTATFEGRVVSGTGAYAHAKGKVVGREGPNAVDVTIFLRRS